MLVLFDILANGFDNGSQRAVTDSVVWRHIFIKTPIAIGELNRHCAELNVSTRQIQKGRVCSSVHLLEKQHRIGGTHKTRCTGDLVEGIVLVLSLAKMVDEHNGNAKIISQLFQRADVGIVLPVSRASCLGVTRAAYLLQGIDHDQFCVGVLCFVIHKLFLKLTAKRTRLHGKAQIGRTLLG